MWYILSVPPLHTESRNFIASGQNALRELLALLLLVFTSFLGLKKLHAATSSCANWIASRPASWLRFYVNVFRHFLYSRPFLLSPILKQHTVAHNATSFILEIRWPSSGLTFIYVDNFSAEWGECHQMGSTGKPPSFMLRWHDLEDLVDEARHLCPWPSST